MGDVMLSVTDIEGVKLQPLKVMQDERGFVKHMLRADSAFFSTFGEIYFSFTKPNVVKAWRYHELITQNMAVPQGVIRLVLFDPRPSSSSYGQVAEIIMGDDNYCLIQIPPQLIYGFQSISKNGALIANCINQPYQPDETKSLPMQTDIVPYQWEPGSL